MCVEISQGHFDKYSGTGDVRLVRVKIRSVGKWVILGVISEYCVVCIRYDVFSIRKYLVPLSIHLLTDNISEIGWLRRLSNSVITSNVLVVGYWRFYIAFQLNTVTETRPLKRRSSRKCRRD